MKKLVILLAMLLSTSAYANINVPTLSPTFDGNDYLKTLSAKTLLQNQWYFGAISNLEHRPLKIGNDKIDLRHTLNLTTSVGLFDTLSLGLFIPIITHQNNMLGGEESVGYGIGNITVDAKWNFLTSPYFSSAIAFPLHLPSLYGNNDLLGDKSVGFSPQIIFELHTKYISTAINAGARIRNSEATRFGNNSLKLYDEAFGSLGVSIPLVDQVSLIGDASISMDINEGGNGRTPAEALGGFKVNVGNWTVKIAAGAGLTRYNGTPEARVLTSIGWTFSPKKVKEIKYVPVTINVPCPVCKKCEKCEEKKCESVKITLRGQNVTSVFFEFDKDEPISTDSLNQVVESMLKFPNLKVILNGFTDSVGTEEYNMVLSLKRANNIKKYLEGKGISSDRILVVPHGEAFSFGDHDEEMMEERRVDALY